MTIFQFDENLNARTLYRRCNANEQRVLRYPEDLRGTKDHVMLPDLLSRGNPLVTSDFTIVEHHTYALSSAEIMS